MSGNAGSGKKNESGKESGGTASGRRNERGNGRGRESENGRETETKTATAGPETESETETGSGRERGRGAATGPPNAAGPGNENDLIMSQISVYLPALMCLTIYSVLISWLQFYVRRYNTKFEASTHIFVFPQVFSLYD